MTSADMKAWGVGALMLALVVSGWLMGFFYAPVDANQGPVYRIMFFHAPCAIAAFISSFVLLIFSIWGLRTRAEKTMAWARASAEVGFLFTMMTLATGSIWGRPTWGTWWTWDARLTTTLILALLYAGWLMMYSSMSAGPGRVRACSVLGILIAADVPIIYQSVKWWRTLHQPQSILREGGASMDPDILHTLLTCMALTSLLALTLGWLRGKNLMLKDELEQASFEQIRT